MSDSEISEPESVTVSISQKKPAPVKALAALAKARQAKAEKRDAEKKEKEDLKKKKEEAVKIVSSLRKPKEPMPAIAEIPSSSIGQPSASDMMAMIAQLNQKLESKSKKKKVIVDSDSSSEEEVIIKKTKKKVIVPAVDPEFELWKTEKDKRMTDQMNKDKENQMRVDLKKLFSRY